MTCVGFQCDAKWMFTGSEDKVIRACSRWPLDDRKSILTKSDYAHQHQLHSPVSHRHFPPPHHPTTPPPDHSATRPPDHSATHPPPHLPTSPSLHLATSPPHRFTTSPPHHLTRQTIRIWDLRAPRWQRQYECPAAVTSVALHPNQTELISGDQNGNVRVWDLQANGCMQEIVPGERLPPPNY